MMHLQLTGRLDPGEQFATINLDGVNLFLGQKTTNLTLLSAVFCHQNNHTHFPNPVKALYPVDPSRYPETITIQRKTRSAQTDDNDEDDDNDDEDNHNTTSNDYHHCYHHRDFNHDHNHRGSTPQSGRTALPLGV